MTLFKKEKLYTSLQNVIVSDKWNLAWVDFKDVMKDFLWATLGSLALLLSDFFLKLDFTQFVATEYQDEAKYIVAILVFLLSRIGRKFYKKSTYDNEK